LKQKTDKIQLSQIAAMILLQYGQPVKIGSRKKFSLILMEVHNAKV
jgi:hypothetical protein